MKFSQNILRTYMHLNFLNFILKKINIQLKKRKCTFCPGQKLRTVS